MALNPVGSGSSLTVSTDTAKVIAAGIAQQAKSLRVTLVGATGMDGAHIKTGTMPTATTADFYLVKGETATLNIDRPSSQRVTGITTGSTTIVQFPEGTGTPFGVGSSVSITVTDQSYYDDIIKDSSVTAVDNTAGVGGAFATRITLDADTSGIVTAVSGYATLRNSFKVSALAKGNAADVTGALYYQQVQVTGEA
tara:strand:+ start:359 stop:946 length:588 start_codon:yes stop_codon:yes gene_type:complete